MLITGIKSRPIYDHLAPILRANRHLLVAQGSGGSAVARLLSEMGLSLAKTEVLYSTESFSGRSFAEEISRFPALKVRLFNTNEKAVEALDGLLSEAQIGTVLYLAGSETFIGRAMQIATKFDLKRDEVLREHCGALARRIFCIHCNAYNENVTHRVFRCQACGESLIVRDHDSRRLAAFMGVKADAETPGMLPPDEELDS